ncbi:Ig-like domain-containing protein [candidate division KSB1 bacterium]|nr:Ig-like domain-containing protein [candidate division KSB1 bacterium]
MKRFILLLILLSMLSSAVYSQVEGLSGWNIVLDPGHSKKENMGIYGHSEAERNVRVALRLREFLLETTDIDTVYLTREDDYQQVSLSQRTDYANQLGAAWYHSIHSDAGSPNYNSTLMLWGQYYNKQEKIPNGGKALSDIMVDLLTAGMRTNTRGSIGDCSFYGGDFCATTGGPYLHVNRTTTMPSELSEAGFHTNPKQNQLFMSYDWKKLEAMTFYWSILELFELERPTVGICTGIISDIETSVPINGALISINGITDTTDTYETVFHQYTGVPDLLHNGFYYIEDLPNETLDLMVTADGFYGDTVTVNINDSFFTFRDVRLINSIPPYIVATTPEPGTESFAAWNKVAIDFSRKMNYESVETTLQVVPVLDGAQYVWENSGTRLIIDVDTLAFETDYTVTISGQATDRYDHHFDGNGDGIGGDDYTFSFRTGPRDMTAPRIVSVYPRNNQYNVETHPIIRLTFSERIDPNSINENIIKIQRSSDYSYITGAMQHYSNNERSAICFFPDDELFSGESYKIKVYPGISDPFGNILSATNFYTFRTSNTLWDFTMIDNFESSVSDNWWNPQQSGTTTGIVTEQTSRTPDNEMVNLLTDSQTSLRINYEWDENATSWMIRVYLNESAPKNVHFNDDYLLQVYVFGDGSGNQFRFALDDNVPDYAAENHEVSQWYTIDWLGWKLVTWDLKNEAPGSWIGDGVLDNTLRFDSIQLTHVAEAARSGAIYFDDLRIVSERTTDVPSTEDEPVIRSFQLFQNYPNPFNPETTIRYSLSGLDERVKLTIYDMLGKEVRTLVNEDQRSGDYKVLWNARDNSNADVASGIYIYELSVGNMVQSKRLVLIR